MEDILYFLMLVGWLAFSFYQQNEKKKRKLAKAQAERAEAEKMQEMTRSPQPPPVAEREPDNDFKRIFEEILMEEHHEPLETVPADEVKRNYDDEAIQERNVYQKYLESNLVKERSSLETMFSYENTIADRIKSLQNEMQMKEEELELADTPVISRFDLRSAVIYSEIIKRKY